MNNLRDDTCAQELQNASNVQKLKYMTNNFRDLADAQKTSNFFGIAVKDHLFVPDHLVDRDSELRKSQLTNCNVKTSLGPLPVNIGFRGQLWHGDSDTEMSIRGVWNRDAKPCKPKGIDFNERTFQLFPENVVDAPNPLLSVENWSRPGLPTRFESHANADHLKNSTTHLLKRKPKYL
jgi:hypothetical protein